jgi:hypothetical protein
MATTKKSMSKGPIKGPGKGTTTMKPMKDTAGGVTRTISGSDTTYTYSPKSVGGMMSKKQAESRFNKAYDERSESYKKKTTSKSSPSLRDRGYKFINDMANSPSTKKK